jgi:hypothetical protein
MSGDVKAAAERVRQWKAGLPLSVVYPASKDHGMAVAFLEVDWRDVAVEYLAEHPDDDGEPVTPEWIETQGWRYTRHPGPGYRVWLPTGQSLDWRFGGCWIGEVPIALTMNRGQIRRLTAALGLTLPLG